LKLFANQERRGTWRDYLPVAAVFFISVFLGNQIQRVHMAQLASDQHNSAAHFAATHAQLLQDNFSRTLAATQGITSILQHFGHLDDFDNLAAEMIATSSTISSLSLAPNGVITKTYPSMGHQAALGLNLLGDQSPDRHAVADAIAKRRTIYSGPDTMVNGMRGIIARTPIFLTENGTDKFWGIVSQLTNLETIGIAAGLPSIAENGFDYNLYSEKDPADTLLSSTSEPLIEPFLYPLQIPAGEWTLAIAPTQGWGQNEMFYYELFAIFIVSALFAGMAAAKAQEGIMLGHQVRQRTAALHTANAAIAEENVERRTIEQGLKASEERWRRLLEHIPYMLLIHDRTGKILNVNHLTCTTLGYSHEQLLARTISDINISLRPQALEQLALLEPGQPLMARAEYRRINAHIMPVEVRTGIINTADGQQVIELARDLNEAIKTEQTLAQVNLELEEQVNSRTLELRENLDALRLESSERLHNEQQMTHTSELSQQANRTRTRFFDNITDGIQAPITAVMAPLNELVNSGLDSTARQLVTHAHQSAQRLDQLIHEMLDFNNLETGTLTIQPQEILLSGLLHEIVSLHAAMANRKQLDFRCTLDPRTPATLRLDPMRLRQILDNLLGNAIKFTAQGHVAIHVAPFLHDDGTHALRIHVSDTGIGIPPEASATIFEPFTQADNSVTRSYGGTGLGLTISHQLAVAMGGNLEIEEGSDPGLRMRLEVAAEPVSTIERLPDTLRNAIAGQAILLISGNECVTGFLTSQLTGWGLEVITHPGDEPLGRPDHCKLVLADSAALQETAITDLTATARLGLIVDEAEPPPPVADGIVVLRQPISPDMLQNYLERAFGIESGAST